MNEQNDGATGGNAAPVDPDMMNIPKAQFLDFNAATRKITWKSNKPEQEIVQILEENRFLTSISKCQSNDRVKAAAAFEIIT